MDLIHIKELISREQEGTTIFEKHIKKIEHKHHSKTLAYIFLGSSIKLLI